MVSRRFFALSPVNITFAYLGFGIAWIATTDTLVALLVDAPDVAAFLQTIKGWVFVALSGAVILGLTRTRERQVGRSEDRLRRATEQIQVLHRMFRHNIRNDVNVIDGYIDLVREELCDEEQREKLDQARDRSQRLTRMSDKVRTLSDVDLADGPNDTVDLVDIVEECLDEVGGRDDEVDERDGEDVTITAELPARAPVRATPEIRHAIAELLENAVKHGGTATEETTVSIAIRREDGRFEVEIVDDGPGIPRHELAPLEAAAESDLQHMSGVGLWIAKWLCEVHDGEIEVEADRGGTTATLRFRAAAQSAGIEAAIERIPGASDGGPVLT